MHTLAVRIDPARQASRHPKYMAILQRLPVDEAQLDAFCRRWRIAKLELFGSMLLEPSRARDIDLLVTFTADARWGLFEHEHMQNELSGLLGRSVDLVSRRAIEANRNALRRNSILANALFPSMSLDKDDRLCNSWRSGYGVHQGDGLHSRRQPI